MLQHSKPEIVVWDKINKKYFIINVQVKLDLNNSKNINLTYENYMQLLI